MASDAGERQRRSRRTRRDTVTDGLRTLLVDPRGWRVLCGAAAVAAMCLGIAGQWLMYTAAGGGGPFGGHFLDLLYGSLGLFVFQPPDLPDTALSAPLQVARFLAPAATLYALADALVLPVARLRARLAHGHAVVCGDGPGALALIAKLRAERAQVVLVAPGAHAELAGLVGDQRVTVLAGDPTVAAVLRRAGVARADRLYVTGPATGRNAAVLITAATIATTAGRHRSTPLRCYAEESDPDVLDALWILLLRQPASDAVTVGFFNTARLGARLLLDDLAPAWTPAGGGPVVVAGLSPFGQELLLQIARRRRQILGENASRLPVVVVDERASAAVHALRARYEVLDALLDLDCHDVRADEADLDRRAHARATGAGFVEQIFVCYGDEELALRKALATARPPTRRSVVVRVDRGSPLGDALRPGRQEGQGPMDALYDDMVIFPQLDAACDPDDVSDDRLEAWAEAIHADYCRQRLESGEASDDNEALVAWENLPEKYRSNNYDQARDIETKLNLIGCASARMTSDAPSFTFTPEEVELLARHEHERWMRNRLAHGWRGGDARDNERLIHPDIRPYDELSTETKDKDAQMVRLIPRLLASAGYRVVRSADAPSS
ncbi:MULTISPECIES: RyR domain-containing protein [Pseudofrankia]|uniref:RyR domain-containing protein n=1 Tax=Pseudofrankia TaxID=2994363 RepID=UPI000234BC34|nr:MULTISPECIES: RyR domain-containing protein [Pseudofrankia]OHV41392.1 ryanodine receptor Ryr [Pseudofrankia sp. EUN1h]